MKQTIKISILTLTFFLFFVDVNSQNNEKTTLKCNIEIVLETNENIENISEDLMLRFLRTFGTECKNNVEFSEFSNETLFKVIQTEPELFCKILENNKNQIEFDEIISELKSPINDLIDLDLTINRIANTKTEFSLKSKLILAINSGNWDKTKKIKELKGSTLLFFQPDSTEFDSIVNSENSEGIYEVSSDFGFYANKIIELYKDSTLNVNISDKRFFIANNELIDKFEQESPYGIILVKSNEFKIETGVFTDVGIQQMIMEYFK
jgi:hypothetical protein